jgi:hypothetical protein
MLFNYSYFQILPLDSQFMPYGPGMPQYNFGTPTDERSHKISVEGIYDLNKWVSLVGKVALKRTWLDSTLTDPVASLQALAVHRVNFHVTRKWDIALEYRIRFAREALHQKNQGFLIEVDRELFDHIRLGVGFNWTDFSDDIDRSTNYNNRGFFTRLSGKF